MNKKILGIAIALSMVAIAFAAVPAGAVDIQTCRHRVWNASDGASGYYMNLAGTHGWSMYWWDENNKGIFQGPPGHLGLVQYARAGVGARTDAQYAMNTFYPDPGGWLYNNPILCMMDNATGYGAFTWTADSGGTSPYDIQRTSMQQIPIPVGVANGVNADLTWTAFEQFNDVGVALPTVDAHLAGYLVYRSTSAVNWNDNPVYGAVGDPTAWTLVGGTVAAPITTLSYTDPGLAPGTYYYSVKYVCDGITSNVASQYGGKPSNAVVIGGANTNAVVTGFAAETGNLLLGDHNDQSVVLQATVSDVPNEGDIITSAQVSIDGGAWVAMTPVDGTFDSPTEDVTYTFTHGFGYYATGVHAYSVRGDDGMGGALTPLADSFNIIDTTIPTVTWTGQPTPIIYTTQPANFIIGYEDFTAYTNNIVNTYISWRVTPPGGAYTNYALTNSSFSWGTFQNILTYTIPGSTFIAGDFIEYSAQVTDGNGNIGLLGAGSFTVADAPPGVQDPYPIYGYVQLYNGNAGAYTPITSTGGQLVTATWLSDDLVTILTATDTVNALGQFSIDLLNYNDGGQVWLTTTFEAPYNNAGYNYTTIDIAGAPGGRLQNVLCGIPYDVQITVPIAGATEMPGAPFLTTYVWYDINGVQCRGYYSFTDGDMIWYSGDTLFVPPAPYQFNGIADQGTHNDMLTLSTGGNQWINISENGNLEIPPNDWPTPWGAIQIPTTYVAGAVVPVAGYLKDWDNITLFVQVGGFDWLVVVGWNMVSVPQDPVNKGGNGIFDSYDALEYVIWQMPAGASVSLADRTGGNPSTYAIFDYGMGEGVAFPMDGVHGYWIWSDMVPTPPNPFVHFNATNYSAGLNVVNAVVGWNLLGFTHNYIVWATPPTASMWADGTVSATLLAADKVVMTQWLVATQWYHSYVDISTFPGMATHNWAWDLSYSAQPGNGYFLWLDTAAVITFNVNQ